MGQYFKGVILKGDFNTNPSKECEFSCRSWDFNNGAKLMEQAWMDNVYVNVYMKLLSKDYNGYHFVWCGDYANDFRMTINKLSNKEYMEKYKEHEYIPYYYNSRLKLDDINLGYENIKDLRYLINYTKKEYVDLSKHTEIHPLPMLTCSGNEEGGGGTYRGTNEDMVGYWAYDCIGVDTEKPEDFKELEVSFEEKW